MEKQLPEGKAKDSKRGAVSSGDSKEGMISNLSSLLSF